MICCCGCKQLIRRSAGYLLTGGGSRGAWEIWEDINSLRITFGFPLFPEGSVTDALVLLSPPPPPLSLSPLYLLIKSEPAFTSPVDPPLLTSDSSFYHTFLPPAFLLPCLAVSHSPALLINNPTALLTAVPPVSTLLLSVSHLRRAFFV